MKDSKKESLEKSLKSTYNVLTTSSINVNINSNNKGLSKMIIKWNSEKSKKLKIERGVSFDELLEDGTIIEISDNPARENQQIFIVNYDNYIYAVPFVKNEDEVFLKTLYRSRKLTKKYLK
jgi:hypothetical protein